jgi:ATP-binding cassette, subfamily B, bacterial PglK
MKQVNFKTFKNLKEILGQKYYIKSLYLLIFMIGGMIFEIFFLNNLVILLDLFTSGNSEKKSILLIKKYFGTENLELKVLAIFFISFFIKTLSNIFVSWKQINFLENTELHVSTNYFKNYLNLPFIYFQRINTANILRKLTEELDNLKIFINAVFILFLELVVLIGITAYLLNYNFFISTISILCFLSFAILLNQFHKQRFLKYGKEKIIYKTGKLKTIIEGLSAIREIKIKGKEVKTFNNFYENVFQLRRIGVYSVMINNLTRPIFEIFLITIIGIFLTFILINGSLTLEIIPILGLYLAASYRLVPSISKIVQSFQHTQLYSPSIENLYRDKKIFDENKIKKINKEKLLFNESIKLENISFSYEENGIKKKIFDNLNFEIKKNSFLGVVGKSGSGKSTLIDILIGLYKPQTGSVLVDGKNIEKNTSSWQSTIGCVPQDVFILDDSLKKNIAFGTDLSEINEEQIKQSIEFSFLKEFSENIEGGLDAQIGERGAKISGGQRQRIGIARAIYNNPEVLIFDESTNALDNFTEKKILDEIHLLKGKKTIILISHKKDNLKNCDKILDLDEKNI